MRRATQLQIIGEVSREPHYLPDELLPETKSELTVPLKVEGRTIGVLDVQSNALNAFSKDDLFVLETLGNQVAIAIENAKLYQEAQQEITAHRQAEEALRELAEKYYSLLESTEDSIYLVDRDCTYLFMNSKYLSRLNLPPDKVVGRPYGEFHSEEKTKEFAEKLKEVFETGKSVQYEHKSLRDDRHFLRTLSPVKDQNGRMTAVTVISKDITGLKWAEEALRNSERRYRLLFARNLAGVYRTTLDGRFLDCNDAFARIFGYDSPEEILGLQASELYFDAANREAFIVQLRKQGTLTNFECRLRRKDGSPVWVLETSSLVEEEEGVPAILQGTLIDITERKLAVEKLQKALESTIQAIGLTTETRDPYTAGHQRRVTQLSVAIARQTRLSQEQIEGIRIAGLLHDIGKMSIPAEILSKPSKLTDMEYCLVQDHPQVAHNILNKIEFAWPVAEIVLQHHERMDGSGYPQGLEGDKILLEACILAVADVVEAMASHRPYRPALGIEKTLEEIAQNKGILYDPVVVDACLRLFIERGFQFES